MALVVGAWALGTSGSSPRPDTALSVGDANAVSTTTATSVPSAPPTSPPPRVQVSGGCGFSVSPGAAPAPVGTCTVLEIGDSLGNDLGWGLARQVGPTSGLDLVQVDKSATGLANSSFYNWPAELSVDLNEYHPQLVLVSLGGNDEQGLDVDGSAVGFRTPAWDAAYLERIQEVVSEATAVGAYVMWVGLPVMEQPSYSAGIETLNFLYQTALARTPTASFVSTWSLFANPQGLFQTEAVVNGTATTLRQSDGVHYSEAGEAVIATYVVDRMAQIYHVRLAPLAPAVITSWD